MRRGFLVWRQQHLACLVVLPAVAHAQSAIIGVVKDTSGAVLPGVTVEAASDALIEKTRSVVTDGERPVPHRRPASRHLCGDLLARRVPDLQARRPRTAVAVHDDDQRRHEGRLARGDVDRDRRRAGRWTCRRRCTRRC